MNVAQEYSRPHLHWSGRMFGRTNFLPVQPGALLPFKNLLGSMGPE